jgi:hypothetical protein
MVVSQSRVIKASILFDSFLFAYPSLIKLSWLIPPLRSAKCGPSKLKTVLTASNRIWHSENRASWHILIIKANKMHYFSNLFDKVLYILSNKFEKLCVLLAFIIRIQVQSPSEECGRMVTNSRTASLLVENVDLLMFVRKFYWFCSLPDESSA